MLFFCDTTRSTEPLYQGSSVGTLGWLRLPDWTLTWKVSSCRKLELTQNHNEGEREFGAFSPKEVVVNKSFLPRPRNLWRKDRNNEITSSGGLLQGNGVFQHTGLMRIWNQRDCDSKQKIFRTIWIPTLRGVR